MPNEDPAVQHEINSVYIQLGVSAVAVTFLICCMVFDYLPAIAAIPLIVGVFNQWLRSPIDIANNNISKIQASRALQHEEVVVHPTETVGDRVPLGVIR